MKREEIEKNATEYAEKFWPENLACSRLSYIGGAIPSQEEIDSLTRERDELKAKLEEAYKWDDIETKRNSELSEKIVQLKETLREATEWISVENRLPSAEETVLVKVKCQYEGEEPQDIISLSSMSAFGWTEDHLDYYDYWDITHWRYINCPNVLEPLKHE